MKLSFKTFLTAAAAAFLLFLAVHYWEPLMGVLGKMVSAASPLITGLVIAYVLNIPVRFFERLYFPNSQRPLVLKSRRVVCMLLSFAVVLALAVLLLWLIIPELGRCVTLLLNTVPATLQEWADKLEDGVQLPEPLLEALNNIDWNQIFSSLGDFLLGAGEGAVDLVAGVTSAVVSFGANLLVGIIFSFYLIMGKERLIAHGRQALGRIFKSQWLEKIYGVFSVFNNCFQRYISGQCIEAVILGVLCAIGMMLLGFPYGGVVGATVGFTALIPVAGAYIGGAVGFLLILTESPIKAVLFVVYLVILQQLENNLIYPKVVGTSLGLPGIWVLAAVIVGGGVLGVPGIILSVPTAAALYQLVWNYIRRGEPAATEPAQNTPLVSPTGVCLQTPSSSETAAKKSHQDTRLRRCRARKRR